jgi:hypothetical protein
VTLGQFKDLLAARGCQPTGAGSQLSARCPAHADKTPSLSITEKPDRILIYCHAGCTLDAICGALGIEARELFFKSNGNPASAPAPRAKSGFDWQRCLEAFTSDTAGQLAQWRGVPAEFWNWLNVQKQLGVYDGKPAFAVRNQAEAVISCHFPTGDGKWRYQPRGQGTHPMIFGDVAKARFVLAFESQWDAFAVMEKLGWHTRNGLPDTAIIVTRGASNAKLIRGRLSPDAVAFAFSQNDEPGRKWLAELTGNAGCQVVRVLTPAPHKDLNDWTRAGAGESEIRAVMKAAKPVQAQPPRVESTGSDFAGITADVRGEILAVLLNEDTPAATKRNAVARVGVEGLEKLGSFFFHADLRDFDSAMYFNRQAKRLERIRGDAFTAWLSDWLRLNRADSFFKYVIAAVETAALSGSQTTGIIPESFWASRPGAIYLSCGDGSAAKITAASVKIVDNGSDGVLFAAGKTLQPWKVVEPKSPFETCAIFRDAHCSATHGLDLLRLWFYSLPTNARSKAPLCLAGDIGAGKTRTAKAFAELYGLPFVAAKVEESEENNFWPACDQGGIYTLDNADSKCRWLADAVASAATDGCSQRRKLYTNAETVTLRSRAWIILTTANPTFANDSGLADRLLLVRMARRDGAESSDSALTEEVLANRDAGLSHIARTLATALADTSPVPVGLNARHPDFAAFAVRIGRAIGREAEAVVALKAAEFDKSAFCLENDAIGAALLIYLKGAQTFTGTAAELVPLLCEVDADLRERLSAKRLGKRLAALWPHVQKSLAVARKNLDRNGVSVFNLGSAVDNSQPAGKREPVEPEREPEVAEDLF